MSTAFARQLGTTRHLHANGRTWTVEKSGGDRMLCEVRSDEYGDGLWIMPGSWRGQPRLGFGALESAAHWRRRALTERNPQYRLLFKRRCWESIEHSRAMRVTHERMIEAREVYAMHAEAA